MDKKKIKKKNSSRNRTDHGRELLHTGPYSTEIGITHDNWANAVITSLSILANYRKTMSAVRSNDIPRTDSSVSSLWGNGVELIPTGLPEP